MRGGSRRSKEVRFRGIYLGPTRMPSERGLGGSKGLANGEDSCAHARAYSSFAFSVSLSFFLFSIAFPSFSVFISVYLSACQYSFFPLPSRSPSALHPSLHPLPPPSIPPLTLPLLPSALPSPSLSLPACVCMRESTSTLALARVPYK